MKHTVTSQYVKRAAIREPEANPKLKCKSCGHRLSEHGPVGCRKDVMRPAGTIGGVVSAALTLPCGAWRDGCKEFVH